MTQCDRAERICVCVHKQEERPRVLARSEILSGVCRAPDGGGGGGDLAPAAGGSTTGGCSESCSFYLGNSCFCGCIPNPTKMNGS